MLVELSLVAIDVAEEFHPRISLNHKVKMHGSLGIKCISFQQGQALFYIFLAYISTLLSGVKAKIAPKWVIKTVQHAENNHIDISMIQEYCQ
ncbi:MAG: hypothetical protein AAF959_27180, partial [Cyanobacteria bacterium P01_D01_bin.56]